MAAEHILQLVPRAQTAVHQPCPAWCQGHFDDPSGERTHQSRRHTTLARDDATGGPAEVRLWSEQHDDGAGSTSDLWVLDVAGMRVEMPCARMYDLLKAAEGAFWRLDTTGSLHPTKERAA